MIRTQSSGNRSSTVSRVPPRAPAAKRSAPAAEPSADGGDTSGNEAWTVIQESPVGRLLVGASDKGVFAIEFDSLSSLEQGTRRAARADADTQKRYRRLRGTPSTSRSPGAMSKSERFESAASVLSASKGSSQARAHARAAVRQLEEYFAGKRGSFDLDLFLTGTDFEERVWRELVKIPHGQTRTYAQIARAAGRPGAARAAGGAIGRNPAAIIVPCHRVVGSGGSLTGFGGGLDRKRWLLDHESGARRLPASAI